MKAAKEGFTIVKQAIGFHSRDAERGPGLLLRRAADRRRRARSIAGLLTERGLKHVVACVEAMKEVLGDEIGLALDCGPGWMVPDAIRLAQALEPLNLMWLEDLITGDYTPYVAGRPVPRGDPRAPSTPIHTGEQIYLRQNFKDLIEQHAVQHHRPRPVRHRRHRRAEVGRRVRRPARHPDGAARHRRRPDRSGRAGAGVGDAAARTTSPSSTRPASPTWWYEIVDGLPNPIVKDGFIEVWDRPGLGVEIVPERARRHLLPEDATFFD